MDAYDLVYNINHSGYDFLVLKGLSLSQYYPIPEDRSFGDIDIYSFGEHENVNDVIRKNGIEIVPDDKHDVFKYEGVTIEHHKTLIGLISKPSNKIEEYLESIATKEQCRKTVDGWYIPNKDFEAVFLLRHMSKHFFGEGLSLKQVLDWGMFLHSTKLEDLHIRKIIEESRMQNAWNTFTAVAGKVLGLDFSSYFIGTSEVSLVNQVMDCIICYRPEEEHQAGLIKRFLIKTRRLFATKWMFDTGLLPDSFWHDIVWISLRDHLRRPSFV